MADGAKIHLNLIRDCEEWLRQGKGLQVSAAIAELDFTSLPREVRLPLAKLARRANQPQTALKILSKLVNETKKSYRSDASPEEFAEYGILLCQIGAHAEGIKILEAPLVAGIAETLLFRSFCLFSEWRYAEAEPLLRRFIDSGEISDYQRAIGRVNLLSVLLNIERHEQARAEADELEADFRASSYRRLLANVLEMKAQLDFFEGRFEPAQAALDEAASILDEDKTSDRLFIDKWRSVIAANRTRNAEPLILLREQALSRRRWESVREADYYRFLLTGDESLFRHLHCGTPHAAYRDRLLRRTMLLPDESYVLGNGPAVFDVRAGTCGAETIAPPGKKIHRLLCKLLSDFYRPAQISQLFAAVFPDEHFNVFSSPVRVHQLIFRARQALRKSGLPLRITENDGLFHFHVDKGLSLLFRGRAEAIGSPDEGHADRLLDHFETAPFTALEARQALGFSASTLNRALKFALASGRLIQLGRGPKTRYQARRIA